MLSILRSSALGRSGLPVSSFLSSALRSAALKGPITQRSYVNPPNHLKLLRRKRAGFEELPPKVINNLGEQEDMDRLEKLIASPLETPKYPNSKLGVVTGTSMAKTVKVDVKSFTKNLKYNKMLGRTKRFYAHDEDEVVKEGDTVRIMPDRPRSKLKRWYVHEILDRKKVVEYDSVREEERDARDE
ncbi:hypothetical protein TL16_g04774 [Triparma laevis f. inornata]|uniref:30S ribosomal protein S17, chloroplastic n=2 Tax=Triparma laevis TaxID=1534972 RepID=A0A9W7KVZ4_9STRA|nr:hypothetical protein TL16_g04774 [Triparma laevis f. inornata]GMI13534.1 hypothetical protein TrLO_g6786 [Triparma laevis f. longispina]